MLEEGHRPEGEKEMKPTQDQLNALKEYAAANGRTWKSKLHHEWMNATASWPLMQIRNQFGPSWLVRFDLRKEVK